MLFLLKSTPKKSNPQPPSAEYLEAVVKEWETVIDYKKEGKVIEVFCYADRAGAFSIWEVETRDELDKTVSRLPFYPFAEFEIIQLITAEEILVKAKNALDSLKSENE